MGWAHHSTSAVVGVGSNSKAQMEKTTEKKTQALDMEKICYIHSKEESSYSDTLKKVTSTLTFENLCAYYKQSSLP